MVFFEYFGGTRGSLGPRNKMHGWNHQAWSSKSRKGFSEVDSISEQEKFFCVSLGVDLNKRVSLHMLMQQQMSQVLNAPVKINWVMSGVSQRISFFVQRCMLCIKMGTEQNEIK